jgi:hypothetical protein
VRISYSLACPGFPRAGGQKLKVFNRNSVPAALRTVLSRPRIECQSSLDEYRPAFGEVLIHILSQPTERSAINKTRFLPLAAILTRPPAICRQSKINHRCLVWRIRQLRVASQIAHQQNFVKISHI